MLTKTTKGLWGKLARLMPLIAILSLLLAACGGTATPVPPTATTMVEVATATVPAMVEAPTATTEAAVTEATATTAAVAEATPTKVKGAASQEGVLTLWVHKVAVQAVSNVAADFTAKYGVQVSVQEVDFGGIRDDLKTAGPAGEGPDIIVGAHDWLGELVANGLVEPLDLGAKVADFDPVGIQAFTYDGKLYGLPYGLEAVALIYNKDLVPTAPTTWEELKTVARQLQTDGKVDQGYGLQTGTADPYHTYPIVTGFGGYVFKQNADGTYDPTDVGLDNAGGQAAMKELDQMVKDGLLRQNISGQTLDSLFVEGKVAMVIGGPWRLGDLRKANMNYGIAKIPTINNQPVPFVGAQGFMVSAFGKNKEVAKAFLTEYMSTPEAHQTIFDADPRIPALLSVQQAVTDPDIKSFAESAAGGQPMPAIPQMSAVWTDWTKALDLVFQQAEDPVKAITDAA
ncbi:MAG: maltose ABC transporter substrate-binding protein, partial [Chloroflexia bacterium]